MPEKILIVINNLAFGGAERLVVDQINELNQRGVWVELLTLVKTDKANFNDRLKLPVSQYHHLELNFNRLGNLWSMVQFLSRRKDFTIITHLFLANTLVRLAALLVWPWPQLVVYEHNVYSQEKGWRHLLMDKFLALFTYRIIAVSAAVRDFWQKRVNPSKVRLVKNGIATDWLDDLPLVADTRRALGLTPDDLVVVSVGNVTPQKGYELILQIAPALLKRYTNLHFLIAGRAEGGYADKLKAAAVAGDLAERVRFLGARSDAPAIMAAADVFFMPSLWEGLSISLLEAMAIGRPIVVTDIPSMKPVIKDPQVGLVFPSGNQLAATALLDDLLADKIKQDDYARRAKLASANYSIDNNIDNLLAAIT